MGTAGEEGKNEAGVAVSTNKPERQATPADLSPRLRHAGSSSRFSMEVLQWRIAAAIVKHPGRVVAISFGIILTLTAIVAASGTIEFSAASAHDWTITDQVESERVDALNDAIASLDTVDTGEQGVKHRADDSEPFFIIAKWKDGADRDVMTPEVIREVCELENLFFKDPDYPQICKLDYSNASLPAGAPRPCSDTQQLSLGSVFYGPATPRTCTLLSEAAVRAKRDHMYASLASPDPVVAMQFAFFASSRFNPATHNFTDRTRTAITLGAPLEGYTSPSDRELEQGEKYRDYLMDVEERLWERFGLSATFFSSAYETEAVAAGVLFKWYHFEVYNLEFNRLVNSDLVWTVGSVVFVYAYMSFHTGSMLLAAVSMLQIVLSLPAAFFIYRFIFQIPFFTQLHILAIFLVLGVGADDVFVFVDAWKQSAKHRHDDGDAGVEENRMVYAYSRTFTAVFNTSFTTAMAFVSTAISPIMPISSFGIFAALCIVLNYVFVITITPAFVLLWERSIRGRSCCCGAGASGRKRNVRPARGPRGGQGGALEEDAAATPAPGTPQHAPSAVEMHGKLRLFELLYERMWAPALLAGFKVGPFSVRPMSLAFIVGLGAFAGLCAYNALQLRPPAEQEEWFSTKHMLTGIGDELSSDFRAGAEDSYRKITFAFGIDGIDRASYNRYVPGKNRGSVVLSSLDLTTAAAQQAFSAACAMVQTHPCSSPGCLDGVLMLPGTSPSCPIDAFYAWHSQQQNATFSPGDLTGTQFVAQLTAFRASPAARSQRLIDSIGIIGGELRFMTMSISSSMQQFQPTSVSRPAHDAATKFLDEVPIKPSFHVAGPEWTWMVTQDALVSSMFTGLAICFPVAFAVLILATGNLVLAFYAVLSIALIVCVVLGLAQSWMGWALGVAESISAVIVVGFSVDYVVHLSHMYIECTKPGREDRVIYSLSHMGVTVLAGGLTTLGAGSFMLACAMTFFTKMAVLMVMTITTSLVYSTGFFMGLCAVAGPQGSFGNLGPIFRALTCTAARPVDPRSREVELEHASAGGRTSEPTTTAVKPFVESDAEGGAASSPSRNERGEAKETAM